MLSTQTKPSLTDEERGFARALILVLEPFRTSPPPSISDVYAFLLVAAEEGKSVPQYAEMAGISPTWMTRNLMDISDYSSPSSKGLGLITRQSDPDDLRKTNSRLTPEGKILMGKIVAAIKTAV